MQPRRGQKAGALWKDMMVAVLTLAPHESRVGSGRGWMDASLSPVQTTWLAVGGVRASQQAKRVVRWREAVGGWCVDDEREARCSDGWKRIGVWGQVAAYTGSRGHAA